MALRKNIKLLMSIMKYFCYLGNFVFDVSKVRFHRHFLGLTFSSRVRRKWKFLSSNFHAGLKVPDPLRVSFVLKKCYKSSPSKKTASFFGTIFKKKSRKL